MYKKVYECEKREECARIEFGGSSLLPTTAVKRHDGMLVGDAIDSLAPKSVGHAVNTDEN